MAVSKLKPEGFERGKDPASELAALVRRGATVEARVVRLTEGEGGEPVWEVDFPGLPGIRGAVPRDEMGLPDPSLAARFVGQRVLVRVKHANARAGLALCSRREAVAESARAVLAKLKPGDTVDCVVKAVLPPGSGKPSRLLVDVGGGLLAEVPKREATWSQSAGLGELFRPGQATKAKVLSVDKEAGRVEVSLRQAQPDPWESAEFKSGDFVSGTVLGVDAERGIVFVEVLPGVVGITPPPLRGELRRGDRVSCAVAKFDREKRRLRLRLRSLLG